MGVFQSTKTLAAAFSAAGIDNTELIRLTNLPKKDRSFYNQSSKLRKDGTYGDFWENNRNINFILPSESAIHKPVPMSGGVLDGSPPANADEQAARMEYINKVFDNEYYQSKYNGRRGLYLAYLYTSHYTENGSYDVTNPQHSFKNLLSNIISSDDITAYNEFFSRVGLSDVRNNFIAVGGAVDTLLVDGLATAEYNEMCLLVANIVGEFDEATKVKVEQLGISGDDSLLFSLMEISRSYRNNYELAENEDELIQMIIDDTENGKVVADIIRDFTMLMGTCAASVYFAPGLGTIVGATWTVVEIMNSAYNYATLLTLGYTLRARVGSRIEIYAGIADRP